MFPKLMKTTSIFIAASALVCAAFLVGCDTPETRISNSPAIFNSLPPDHQAMIKKGQIQVGFNMDEVKLALGDPSHVTLHTDSTGQHQVWHYVQYEDNNGVIIFTGYYHRWGGWGGPRFWGDVGYYDGYPVRVHDRIRVSFDTANLVASIEQEKS
jgi:outer membrane protein assembly factor BamE (lipoprotein component of BamABCDE complex)